MRRIALGLITLLASCGSVAAPQFAGAWAYSWPTHAPDGGPLVVHGTMTLEGDAAELVGVVDCPGEWASFRAYWNWRVSGPAHRLLLASDHAVWDDDWLLVLEGDEEALRGPMLPYANPADNSRGYVFSATR